VQTVTTAALVLYVDPAGNDNNACTASGAAACQTFAGACSKIPHAVKHDVSITHVDGTYTSGGCELTNDVYPSGTIRTVWTPTTATVATGTATGTLTAGPTTANALAYTVFTDGAQSLTSNDLVGKWACFGAAATAGVVFSTSTSQCVPIDSNTATTFTMVGQLDTAVISGAAYRFVTVASVIASNLPTTFVNPSGSTISSAWRIALGVSHPGAVRIDGLKFSAGNTEAISLLSGDLDAQHISCNGNGGACIGIHGTKTRVADRWNIHAASGQRYMTNAAGSRAGHVASKNNKGTAGLSFIRLNDGCASCQLQWLSGSGYTGEDVLLANTDATAIAGCHWTGGTYCLKVHGGSVGSIASHGPIQVEAEVCNNPTLAAHVATNRVTIEYDLATNIASTGTNTNNVPTYQASIGAKHVWNRGVTAFTESTNPAAPGCWLQDGGTGNYWSPAELDAMSASWSRAMNSEGSGCGGYTTAGSAPGFVGDFMWTPGVATSALPTTTLLSLGGGHLLGADNTLKRFVWLVGGESTWRTLTDSTSGLVLNYTDTSGTPGAATINKPSGRVAIAAAAASVTVTDSKVTAASNVLAVLQTVDATCTGIQSVVPGSGSFVVTANAACTGNTSVGWIVAN
jgi:hypothetical protein